MYEQQPEPVSRDDLADVMDGMLEARMGNPDSIQGWDVDEDLLPIADRLLSRYTITRKPQDDADEGGTPMSDRDESLPAVKELAEIIDEAMDTSVRAHGEIPNWRWDGPLNTADAVLAAGFRRTVTPAS